MKSDPTLIFDGVCNLCEGLVIFVVNRDKDAKFKFVTAQSPTGRRLQQANGVDAMEDTTMVLLKDDKVFTRSDAAIEVARELDGPWKMLAILAMVPRPLRDRVYTWIGNNRYKWFGIKKQCLLPTRELESRFLR